MEFEEVDSEKDTKLEFPKKRVAEALFFVGIFIFALGVGLVYFKNKPQDSIDIISSASVQAESAQILVDVEGEVARPGLYRLNPDARVDDAIREAGGMTDTANRNAVNLAAKISDGQKITVPGQSNQGSVVLGEAILGLVNINSSTQAELESLPGVGPATATKIIDARPYSTFEELVSKKAVSSSVFAKIKNMISL